MYEDLKDDEFVDVPGWEGLYEINKMGQVKSADRYIKVNGVFEKYDIGKIVSHTQSRTRYLKTLFYRNNVRKFYMVHRIVAIVFIENPHSKKCVNHIDGNPHNNHISNLEWCTHAENIQHAYDTGLAVALSGEGNNRSKIILNTLTGIFYFGVREAAAILGYHPTALRKILNNRARNYTPLIYV